jgi:hypothetical protein
MKVRQDGCSAAGRADQAGVVREAVETIVMIAIATGAIGAMAGAAILTGLGSRDHRVGADRGLMVRAGRWVRRPMVSGVRRPARAGRHSGRRHREARPIDRRYRRPGRRKAMTNKAKRVCRTGSLSRERRRHT